MLRRTEASAFDPRSLAYAVGALLGRFIETPGRSWESRLDPKNHVGPIAARDLRKTSQICSYNRYSLWLDVADVWSPVVRR